jgi:hypothetical protein
LPFVSLSTFVVDFFISCIRGSQDNVIRTITGGKNPENITGLVGDDKNGTDRAAGVMAKHTLRITLTSNLPEVEGMIHHQE